MPLLFVADSIRFHMEIKNDLHTIELKVQFGFYDPFTGEFWYVTLTKSIVDGGSPVYTRKGRIYAVDMTEDEIRDALKTGYFNNLAIAKS